MYEFNEVVVGDMYGFYPYCEEYEIISFDLFDTLIYRRHFSLEEIKFKVYDYIRGLSGYKFHVNEVKFLHEHFSNLLKDSRRLDSDEPILLDVYETVLSSLGIDHKLASDVVKYEVELEAQNLDVYEDVHTILSKLKADNKKIVITSDMYFDQKQIKLILKKLGLLHYFDEVYVSSEYKERKATSKLFKLLFNEPHKVIHVGDNHNNDYKQALKSKIFAVHLVRNHPVLFGSTFPLMHIDNREHLVELMSESFVMMTLKTFDYALTHNIKKILFLSRDATPLIPIAKEVKNSSFGDIYGDIQIGELCVGRNSLGFLDARNGKYFLEDVLDRFAWMHHGSVTLGDLLTSFEIDFNELNSADLALKWYGRPAAEYAASVIKKRYPKLEKLIEQYILKQNTLAIKYLEQTGAVGNGSTVLVDVGYSGTIALYIANYLTRDGTHSQRAKTDMHVLMFLTSDNVVGNAHFSQPYAKIREGLIMTREGLPNILKTNFSWLEVFFKNAVPDRGPLLRYIERDGEVLPEFKLNLKPAQNILLSDITELAINKLQQKNLMKYLHPVYLSQIRNLMIETFKFPSQGIVDAVRGLEQEFSPLQTEVRSIIYDANGYKTLKATHEMIKKDYWVAGSYQANGVGKLISSFDEIVQHKNKLPFWLELQKENLGLKK